MTTQTEMFICAPEVFHKRFVKEIKVLKALQKVLLFAIAEFNFTAATKNTERILIKH